MHRSSKLLFAVGAALATVLSALPATAQNRTRAVQIEIDFAKKPDAFVESIQSLGAALADSDIVYLDLTIKPAVARGRPNYRVVRQRNGARPVSVTCADGYARFSRGGERFGFAFNPDYNHLILDIEHAPAAQAPFNTVGCSYRASEEYPTFFIKGYFAVSQIGIPAANDIELRPVSPSVAPLTAPAAK